jgi:RNA-directed DNA polymerase
MSQAATLAGAAPGSAPDWHAIPWPKVWRTVRRLQARIVKAVRAGKWGKVKALVYLLTHSFSGRALAILRVISNSGATTPGVDGVTWDTPEHKAAAFGALRRHGYRPQPLRRTYLPKSHGKLRALGIPVMVDRAMQALYLLAFDPIAETCADRYSFGFRSARCCADALQRCRSVLQMPQAADWVLEGDIRSCFDKISHAWLLTHAPLDKVILRQWLKAGFLEKHVWHASTAGTPQGGLTSPALANWTLDGLEDVLRQHYANTPQRRRLYKVHLVRYADDFVITGTSQVLLEYGVKPLVVHFLRERGLELCHEKTRITHKRDGFDFLGQNLRRYDCGKLLLKPSAASVTRFLAKIQEVLQEQDGSSVGELILTLNKKIKGWAMYHRHACSKRTFSYVDHQIHDMLWRWCQRRHRQKSHRWIREKYFKRLGNRDWVFTGIHRDRKGRPHLVCLLGAAQVRIIRHVMIKAEANPYDPAWEDYFDKRLYARMRLTLAGRGQIWWLWQEQQGRCPGCGQQLRDEEPWQLHHRIRRVDGGGNDLGNLELYHANCHRQRHSQESVREADRVSREALERLEPDAL